MENKVNVLGTNYKIIMKDFEEDASFFDNRWAGYCSEINKEIVLCNMKTFPSLENESIENCEKIERTTLMHEMVHAFLNESGLSGCSNSTECWAKNEEMVDWMAIQIPKIMKAYEFVTNDFKLPNSIECKTANDTAVKSIEIGGKGK